MTDLSNILRSEGIYKKGYGIVPKAVMLDPGISADAKAIYSYFCSYAGAGETAFPSRDRIVSDLGINKDSYYKHLGSLIDLGLITVTQENRGGRGRGYQRNVYTLVSLPKRYKYHMPEPSGPSSVSASGIRSLGYGTVSKSVMTDPGLHIKAKALYACLCAFTGGGASAFPRRDDTCYYLGISKNTYTKYLSQLTKADLITVKQRRSAGKLSVCDYYINEFPGKAPFERAEKEEALPCTNISDTQQILSTGIEELGEMPCTKSSDAHEIPRTNSSDTQKDASPCTKSSDTKKPDTKKPDTIINNNTKNRNYNKQHISDHHQDPVKSFADLLSDDDWTKLESVYSGNIILELIDRIDDSFEGRDLSEIKHPLNYAKTVLKTLGY